MQVMGRVDVSYQQVVGAANEQDMLKGVEQESTRVPKVSYILEE